jgi:N-acetylglucosamine-6-phosphate deacetylase
LSDKNELIVVLGHTNASAEQIMKAVENGARLSTHLGNGCANFIHRHLNPIWPQLANNQLTATIIADGQHLLPEEIQVFYKVKGPDNIILTSDIMYLAGMAPGKYTFLGNEVILTEDGKLINPRLNCLAGASFPLKKGVENIMNYVGCSLTRAINMASLNVARIYSLHDRGKLAQGYRADIILFEREGNRMILTQTFLKGKPVSG